MAFVNEKVYEKEKIESGIKDLVKEYYEKDNMKSDSLSDEWIKWTIDRERDLVFLYG